MQQLSRTTKLVLISVVVIIVIVICTWAALPVLRSWVASINSGIVRPNSIEGYGPGVGETGSASYPYYRVMESGDTTVPSLDLNQAMAESGKEVGVWKANTYAEAHMIAFESLNDIDKHIERLAHTMSDCPNAEFVVGIRGTDYMASKSALVSELRRTVGQEETQKILPDSYVLTERADMERLHETVTRAPNEIFICKKNIQRQQGAAILKGSEVAEHLELARDEDPPYVVCQRVLQNPLLVGKRKINLRVYMLAVLRKGESGERQVEFWACRNGFLYYSPKLFEPMTTDPEHVITTGYIDRAVYAENPLTLMDLKAYMGDVAYGVMWGHVLGALGQIKRTYTHVFKNANQLLGGKMTQFMVYGVDVAPAADLSVKIMEINKGPDMSYKDERDKEVKYNMALDTYKIVFRTPASSVGFDQI